MTATNALPEHWLVTLARQKGFNRADTLDVDPRAGVAEAYRMVEVGCDVTSLYIATAVAEHFQLPLADWSKMEVGAVRLLPERTARRLLAYPVRSTGATLQVAVADPTNRYLEQDIAFASGRNVVMLVGTPDAITVALGTGYGEAGGDGDGVAAGLIDAVRVIDERAPEQVSLEEAQDSPTIGLVNLVLREAVRLRASDIHVEPVEAGGRIRFRVDGLLRFYTSIPGNVLSRVISRIKIMGRLNISDRLRPQDGAARVEIMDRRYDLRISTIPTRRTEKAVIRILDPGAVRRFSDLGIPEPELRRLEQLLTNRTGIVAVTGPTGSGKTTTLYAALQRVHTPSVNVVTIEDPVEYDLPGVTQIQVEAKQDVTFAATLRSTLRQDPDVILVGEVRDGETAETAARAAATGHLVLTTLHTNNAVGGIGRLVDLGLNPLAIVDNLRGIVGQRLLRRLCKCSMLATPPRSLQELVLFEEFRRVPNRRAMGCAECAGTGYRGRFAVAEVLIVTPDIEQLILRHASSTEIQEAAKAAGMRTMLEAALEGENEGLTTLDEILRVIGSLRTGPDQVPGEPWLGSNPPAGRGRILLADDMSENVPVLAETLRHDGWSVTTVEDGEAARQALTSGPFECAVLALRLPGISGRNLLREIRATARAGFLAVVIVTSLDSDDVEAQVLEEGADDYLQRPLDGALLSKRCQAAVLRRRTT